MTKRVDHFLFLFRREIEKVQFLGLVLIRQYAIDSEQVLSLAGRKAQDPNGSVNHWGYEVDAAC
jgi:hypothetical protein